MTDPVVGLLLPFEDSYASYLMPVYERPDRQRYILSLDDHGKIVGQSDVGDDELILGLAQIAESYSFSYDKESLRVHPKGADGVLGVKIGTELLLYRFGRLAKLLAEQRGSYEFLLRDHPIFRKSLFELLGVSSHRDAGSIESNSRNAFLRNAKRAYNRPPCKLISELVAA